MVSSRWKLQFLTIWTGQAFSLIGSELVGFALIWWLTLETGSGLTLAMATVVTYLPIIALSPLAGTLVDRWDRRLIMIAADGAIALFSLLLAYLYWRGAVQVWHIYATLFLRSLGTCFHLPAMQASTPLIVPEAYLVRVAGMNEALSGVVFIVASPLAVWLLSLLSMQGILAIDVVTALVAIVTLLFVHIPQPERMLEKRARFVGDLGAGARYLSSRRGLFWMIAIGALSLDSTLGRK